MKEEFRNTLKTLLEEVRSKVNHPDSAMKLTQAALNLVNAERRYFEDQ